MDGSFGWALKKRQVESGIATEDGWVLAISIVNLFTIISVLVISLLSGLFEVE